MKLSKNVIAITIIGVAAVGLIGLRSMNGNSAEGPGKVAERTLGEASAPVKIVEYADFQCPSCANASAYLHQMVEKHPGKIQLEFKYFPLRNHAHSVAAASTVECSGRQGKFWEMHNLVFETQKGWHELPSAGEFFRELATQVGLDVKAWQACVENPETQKFIMAEKEAGLALKIQSTPTVFVNGEMFVGFNAVVEKLDQLLAPKPE